MHNVQLLSKKIRKEKKKDYWAVKKKIIGKINENIFINIFSMSFITDS